MKWWAHLYKGRKAELALTVLFEKIEKNEFLPEVYVITSGRKGHHLFEIHPSMLLREEERKQVMVLGVAIGYQEAAQTVRRMVDDMVRATGGFQWEEYMRQLDETSTGQTGE